jgi:hypothetical protein
MPKSWTNARELFATYPHQPSFAWISLNKSVRHICTKAEIWGIDPYYANRISVSNWIEIVAEAKRAIRWGQKEYLAVLFQLAAELTNRDLRLAIHSTERDLVQVEQDEEVFILRASRHQFERIRKNTMLNFEYRVRPRAGNTADTYVEEPDQGGFRELIAILGQFIGNRVAV